MKNNPLVDQRVVPDETLIGKMLGKYHPLWITLFERISGGYPDLAGSWKYYRDGRTWLFRIMRKSKTIFWLSLLDDTFRVTFYFNAKNEHSVYESAGIPDALKKSFRETNEGKKFRNMTVTVRKTGDIDTVMTLIDLKLV